MNYSRAKTKLVFLPLLFLGSIFISAYILLYWLFYIHLDIIPLKENVVQYWIPVGLSSACVLLFIRPRVHLLKLDKDNGRIRPLYYMIAAAVFCIPAIISTNYLDSATGRLTFLHSIKEISQRSPTKYYKVDSYVLKRDDIGIESVMSYSGKRNQYLDLDIYIAIPFTADLQDTQSPAAFLSVHYHRQVSGKLSEEERRKAWNSFWEESFGKFDSLPIQFTYLEKIGNNKDRDRFQDAARKSDLYQPGATTIILKPVKESFEQRNGDKFFYIFFSFVAGLFVWFIMIAIPGIHEEKAKKNSSSGMSSARRQLTEIFHILQPEKGFRATPVFILINLLVFIVMVFKGLGFITFDSRDLVPFGAIYEPAIQQGEWWRLITGMFLHGGIMHLLMNMISLYLVGIYLERFIHTKRFILAYLISGIAATLVSLWWHDKPVVAVGASGAIFGLYGIVLALISFRMFDASINKLLLILLACTAGYSLLIGFLSEGIDNSAHLGGLIAGFISGIFFAKTIKSENEVSKIANL